MDTIGRRLRRNIEERERRAAEAWEAARAARGYGREVIAAGTRALLGTVMRQVEENVRRGSTRGLAATWHPSVIHAPSSPFCIGPPKDPHPSDPAHAGHAAWLEFMRWAAENELSVEANLGREGLSFSFRPSPAAWNTPGEGAI